jgi:hypothetical protein
MTTSEGKIHIYLLEDQESRVPLWEIETADITLQDRPFINYGDILFYNASEYTFKITESAQERMEGEELHSRTFALVADGEIIYTGYFWASYSSSSCPWLTIDPIRAQYAGELGVSLGYPGFTEGMNIPDHRNDKRIINILRQDRKLKE